MSLSGSNGALALAGAPCQSAAVPPHAAMADLINAFRVTQLTRVVAMFSFADHLADGPKTASEIARV